MAIFLLGILSGCGGAKAAPPTPPTPSASAIQWATPASVPVGTALSAGQLSATATGGGSATLLAGNFVYVPALGTVMNTAGPRTLSVTFSPNDTSLYTAATASVTLNVNPGASSIHWPVPAAVVVGTALSATQLNATVSAEGSGTPLAGTFAYLPASGTVMATVGVQTLSVTFTPTDTANYAPATASVPLSVVARLVPTAFVWKDVQIVGGGFVTGIVMHPAQKGLMYARTDVGGAFRWDSASPAHWTPLTDWITRANSNYIGIESIGLDPADPQRLYLAVGMYAETWGSNGAILISGDQGNTFTTVPLPIKLGSNDDGRNAGERLAVDPNLGSVIYFGSRLDGLWKSVDKGATWSQVSSFPVLHQTSGAGVVFETFTQGASAAGSPSQQIYVGVSAKGTGGDPRSLYVTSDAGATWQAVPNAPTGLYVTHGVSGPDGNLYLTYGDATGPGGLNSGKLFQYVLPTTSNPSGTWNDITPPRLNSYSGGYGAVALDPERPGVIMVSTLDHYYPVGDDLWRSLDYGKTWYSINTVGANRDASLAPWMFYGQSIIGNTGNWVASMQIDPFDPNHVVYGTGGTVWTTNNMTASDGQSNPSTWTIGAQGLEETVILALASPPSGPANLVSALGDLGNFQHMDLTRSPAAGAMNNPRFTTGTSIDFAQAKPNNMARVGYGSTVAETGAWSNDGGSTWAPFATAPAGIKNGAGTIAVAADGAAMVWSPSDGATAYSIDHGNTWVRSVGASANQRVVADRINPRTFYMFDSGSLLMSADAGATFATVQTGLPGSGALYAAYDAEGDLWLATNSGLYHAALGTPLVALTTADSAWGVTAGMPLSGSNILTLYMGGQVGGQAGLFRSIDNAATWTRIDDPLHEFAWINALQGDPRIFGRVYLGTGGRGIVYGDSAN